MPSPDDVVDFALAAMTAALESIRTFAEDDPNLLSSAESALLDRRVPDPDHRGKTWPGGVLSWAIHSAVLGMFVGLAHRGRRA